MDGQGKGAERKDRRSASQVELVERRDEKSENVGQGALSIASKSEANNKRQCFSGRRHETQNGRASK